MLNRREVAAAIEATILGPDVTETDVRHVCAAALVNQVRGACVPLEHVRVANAELGGSGIEIVTVAGFPGGDDPTAAKVEQVRTAAAEGAYEVDVVMAYRQLVAGDVEAVRADLAAVVHAADAEDLAVKIILETGTLDPDLIDLACELCVDAGADWVKTCTGYGPRGATTADVRRMRAAVGDRAQVKAAGGIRSWEDAVAMLEAGADAVGCSSFLAILDGAPR